MIHPFDNQESTQRDLRTKLFTDLDIPVANAAAFLADMEKKPNKVPAYKNLLSEHLESTISRLENQEVIERRESVCKRVEEWEKEFGPALMREVVAMSRLWNVPVDKIITRKITPELIKEMLDEFLVGQEEYKIQLSLAFYTYLMKKSHRGSLPKSNLLVCGPSGSGKTYGMNVLASLFNVPYVVIHCNNLVQEGIVGATLTTGFTSLLKKWTLEEIKGAVVCFDEFDKLFEQGEFNARVINEMLNIIDDKGKLEFREDFDQNSKGRTSIPTDKMMFVFTGVFEGLQRKKSATSTIGFKYSVSQSGKENLDAEDFIRYGIKPEIMGRIQNFITIDALSEEQLFQIFDRELSSPFTEYERYFAYNDIQAVLTDEGKRTLAKMAKERGMGVRGLKGLLHQALLEDMYDLEVGEEKILNITEKYIYDNLK